MLPMYTSPGEVANELVCSGKARNIPRCPSIRVDRAGGKEISGVQVPAVWFGPRPPVMQELHQCAVMRCECDAQGADDGRIHGRARERSRDPERAAHFMVDVTPLRNSAGHLM
jgi:hypothetical protein